MVSRDVCLHFISLFANSCILSVSHTSEATSHFLQSVHVIHFSHKFITTENDKSSPLDDHSLLHTLNHFSVLAMATAKGSI